MVKKFSSGAVRSNDADGYRLDLVPAEGLIRAGMAAAHGAEKYGEHNWQKGMPLSEFLNHLLVHIYKYIAGDRSEDHLGHAVWNAMAACTAEERGWTAESLAKGNEIAKDFNGDVFGPTQKPPTAAGDVFGPTQKPPTAAEEFQKALLEEFQKHKFKKGREEPKWPPTTTPPPTTPPPVLGPTYPFKVVEQKKVGNAWELMICVDIDDQRKAFITIRSMTLPGQSELESVVRQYMNERGLRPGDEDDEG